MLLKLSIQLSSCVICMLMNFRLWTLIGVCVSGTVFFSVLTPARVILTSARLVLTSAHVVLCVVKLPSVLIGNATVYIA